MEVFPLLLKPKCFKDQTGEMVLPFRALAALPEDLDYIPNMHMMAHKFPGAPVPSSALFGNQVHMWYTNLYASKTPIDIIKCLIKSITEKV